MPQDTLKVPELSLILLIGSTGAGKSTFARRLFKPTEIVSSDACRGLVADDENDQSASKDAFELLHYLVAKRLKRGLLTVVDATNVQEESRRPLVALARQYHVLPVAIVLDVPEAVAQQRNAQRPDRRHLGRHVIASHRQQLRRSLRSLKEEGFRHIHHLRSVADIDAIQAITREQLYNNRKEETGPFDLIGDVHGCYDELCALLEKLGYQITEEPITDVRDLGVRVVAPLVVQAGASPPEHLSKEGEGHRKCPLRNRQAPLSFFGEGPGVRRPSERPAVPSSSATSWTVAPPRRKSCAW
ncbi:AAA family ATPase [Hymenobacter sp. BRD67]|uniref:AAA family ATPase n=1 Tax=Hymenobacter sp. BRD67 TaxID=2675877 RepID=UPI0020B7021F|nr:AAA family ATPase [Hymenobacter sp. BRD67]